MGGLASQRVYRDHGMFERGYDEGFRPSGDSLARRASRRAGSLSERVPRVRFSIRLTATGV